MSDRSAGHPRVLGEAATNVFDARQAHLSGSRINSGQHVIWYVTYQDVAHMPMISHDISVVERWQPAEATSSVRHTRIVVVGDALLALDGIDVRWPAFGDCLS